MRIRQGWVAVLVTLVALAAALDARGAGKGVQGAVNLNTAAPEVLGLLPGIGPAKAQAILAYRKRHPFRTVDELVRIKGIGRKMVRHLRAHLAVGGPTTAVATDAASPPPPPPPAPPVAVRRPGLVACVRPLARPVREARPSRARPSHGSCPQAP